jgi:hypothetical protein
VLEEFSVIWPRLFDYAKHEILVAKLHFYGTETTFINWLRSFLTDRKQSAQTHHRMALGMFSQPRNNKMWIFPRVNSSMISFHKTGRICALRLYVPMYTRVDKNPLA